MTSAEPDSYLGREIAGYRVEEIIGRGGMGVVYRAEHIRLGRKVALKVVAPQIAREEKFRERFLRESRTAGTLDHPNVVPMYDAGEADGVLYIAMRFVDGVDLATMISRDGPLEPARAARIVSQVASALDAAHEAGLVHRDVKPSNVLLPARGAGRGEHAYLGDFGLTKRVLSESGVTGTSAFLGTIAYVAPEQIEGRPVDAKADQYSLACLTYECLTGHRPFERETDIATLYAHIRDPFPSVAEAVGPELAPAIDAILARAAAKQPHDRYPSCGDMAEDLARATNAAITGSSPIPVVTATSGRRGTRRRLVLGVGSALAVVAVVISAVVVAQNLGSGGPVVQGHGVAIIDATTNLVTATVTLAAEPTAIAADGTAGWVAHFDTSSVSRVDADDHAVANISVGDGPQAIVAGDPDEADQDPGRVWTANATGETLSTIEADDPQGTPSTLSLQFRPGAMAFGNGGLWVIEPQTDSVRDIPLPGLGELAVEVGAEPIAIAAGDGTVWTANRIGQSLSRFTVGLTSADAPIPLGFTPGPIALDLSNNVVWIVDTGGDAVVRFDVFAREEVSRVAVTDRPVAVAYGADAVWVADASGIVSRIDPATDAVVETIAIGGSPRGIAVAGNLVWVIVAEG